jgi:hypothetical protein
MTIDRRNFVTGAALTALAPTLTLLPASPPALAVEVAPPVILIDGWSVADQSEAAVWLRVGRTWTAAWR